MSRHGRHKQAGGRAGSSLTSSRPGRAAGARRGQDASAAVARDLDLTESALRRLGRARPRRSHEGQDRPDDGGARGAGAAAQRKSRAADGARNPKKSRGLLREAPAVKFAWIAAEKAIVPRQRAVPRARRVAERLLRLASAARIGARAAGSPAEGAGARVVRREQAAATAARGSTRISSSRRSASAGSA